MRPRLTVADAMKELDLQRQATEAWLAGIRAGSELLTSDAWR